MALIRRDIVYFYSAPRLIHKRCGSYHSDKMDIDNLDDFFIQADNGQIYFKIEEAPGFPTDTDYYGGYDTRSRIEIKSGNYSVKGQIYITTGNLYNFFRQFEECYRTLKGTATLESYEKNLLITLDFDGLGHVRIRGHLTKCNTT